MIHYQNFTYQQIKYIKIFILVFLKQIYTENKEKDDNLILCDQIHFYYYNSEISYNGFESSRKTMFLQISGIYHKLTFSSKTSWKGEIVYT